jgi:hypothetical protein
MNGLLDYYPAAFMGGDTFVMAAQKFGLPDDIDTLNKIVNLVNNGMSPDQAAEAIAKSSGGSKKTIDKLDDVIKQGIASYGARYAESPSEPLSMKGKGYFGLLPSSEGFSTEISATDDQGMSYPLLVPTLTQQEVNYLLQGGEPTDEIYNKAMMWATSRQASGQSPFAAPTELRMPVGLLESR